MPRYWFVGDTTGLAAAPIASGDMLVPLDGFAQEALGDRGLSVPSLREWESTAVLDVLADFDALIGSLSDGRSSRHWLSYRGHDFSGALAKPDQAFLGLPRQRLAHRIASQLAPRGEVRGWGVNRFQLAGIRAAVGSRLVDGAGPAPSPVARGRGIGPRLRALGEAIRPRSGRAATRGGTDILYLGLEAHVVRQQERVLEALATEYSIEAVLPLREPWAWPADVSFQPERLWPLSSYLDARSVARLLDALRRTAALPDARALRVPSWMAVEECRRWIRREWWRGAVFAEALGVALENHRPRLLIGTNLFSQAGKVTTAVCESAGVPALGLPSGADQMIPPHVTASDIRGATYAVCGSALRDRLVAGGAPADRLAVCGLPELDSLEPLSGSGRQALFERHGLDPGRPLVTFFSSPSLESDQLIFPKQAKLAALDSLISCRERAGVELLVKLHPRETDGVIAEHLASRGLELPVSTDPLPEAMAASDVVASLASAVTFTALLLDKPALLLHFERSPLLSEVFRFTGAGIAPASPGEVPAAIERALSGAARQDNRAFVRDWLAGGDGRASERIVALAKRLLG